MRLCDLGERRIVDELIGPLVEGCGDDCASVPIEAGVLCITTDPAPFPAARALGARASLFYDGWLSVVINASDLAAAAASPLGFLVAIECPRDLEVSVFKEMVEGVKQACEAEGLPYLGGNIRESATLRLVGTAIGWSRKRPPGRGAHTGSSVWSIGEGGLFWRDTIAWRESGRALAEESPVIRPRSQLDVMRELGARVKVKAAIDNSDGLLPSLEQLARASETTIELDLDALLVPGAAAIEVDPARLWLGWGDWNVIIVLEEHVDSNDLPSTARRIGSVVGPSAAPVLVRRGEVSRPAPRLESERFAKDSWFSNGLDAYLKLLLEAELP